MPAPSADPVAAAPGGPEVIELVLRAPCLGVDAVQCRAVRSERFEVGPDPNREHLCGLRVDRLGHFLDQHPAGILLKRDQNASFELRHVGSLTSDVC